MDYLLHTTIWKLAVVLWLFGLNFNLFPPLYYFDDYDDADADADSHHNYYYAV
jgi:hypothetical protein